MKHIFLIVAFVMVSFAIGCCKKQMPAVQTDAPLKLTQEEVMMADDGTRIIIYFPDGVEKPVVFKSVETGTWITSAKLVEN